MKPSSTDRELLQNDAHRPWPLPRRPWVMRQTWNDLLFAHWAVDPALLRPCVPPQLELDVREGKCWVGITPFFMTGVAVRGVPAIPGFNDSPELNVRTYVTVDGKPGVYFFSLDIYSLIAVMGARMLYALPYFFSFMQYVPRGDDIYYRCGRVDVDRADPRFHGNVAPDPALLQTPARFQAHYWPTTDIFFAEPGSLEYFLTERYCLYAVDHGKVYRADIHHLVWPLQRAGADIAVNTMALADGIRLPDERPHLLFARRLDVLVWLPQRVHRDAIKIA